MRQIYFLYVLVFGLVSCNAISKDVKRNLPNELRDISVGLEVNHFPAEVKATRDTEKPHVYKWTHATTVVAKAEAVQIEEFGAYVWEDEKWEFSTFTGKPFTADDFEKWYGCKGGRIEKGASCTDNRNWSSSLDIQHPRILWYYIGITQSGKRVIGYKEVIYRPELDV